MKSSVQINTIHQGDTLMVLESWPDSFIHCCVTSPPYWNLRDYGVPGQLGLEKTPQEYVEKMAAVFREVRRVLRDDGTLWLNLGDCYASSPCGNPHDARTSGLTSPGRGKDRMTRGGKRNTIAGGFKAKDLCGIPWRVAFTLQADGWYLRSDIIWHKPNPMPESVTDRPTRAHDYIFLLAKSERYYYDADAIKEPGTIDTHKTTRQERALLEHKSSPTNERNGIRLRADKQRGHGSRHAGFNDRWDCMSREEQCSLMRNKRSVWTVPTYAYPEAHFATFPPNLIKPCILAGSPAKGIVLDPFMGAGTTALVACGLNRQFVGIELNPEYIRMAERRIAAEKAQGKLF